jgi:hypothetical protein
MLLEFLELFFNGEMWHSMRWFLEFLELFFDEEIWCGMLFEFSAIFLIEKDNMTWDDVTYLHVEKIKINDL